MQAPLGPHKESGSSFPTARRLGLIFVTGDGDDGIWTGPDSWPTVATGSLDQNKKAGVLLSLALVTKLLHQVVTPLPHKRKHNVVRLRRSAALAPLSLLPLLACVHACSTSEIDPAQLPYRLVVERQMPDNTGAVDLDSDGRDEYYHWYQPSQHANQDIQALVFYSQTSGVIDQINFTGLIQTPLFRDLNGDKRLEALVPVTRNDSLFLGIVDANGRKQSSIFLAGGKPRIEPEGVIPWNAAVIDAAAHDFDNDGSLELITVVSAGYARLPRGVLVHRLKDGKRIGQAIVGAPMRQSIIDDFDGDGRPEVFVVTAVTNNGAAAGGFDDAHSYIMVFQIWPTPGVKWHRELPGRGVPNLARADQNGDGRPDIIVMGSGIIEILDTRSWQIIRSRRIASSSLFPTAVDVDRDGRLEILTLVPPHDILLFDDRLALLRSSRVEEAVGTASTLPDLDGDAVPEIVIGTYSGFLLLGPGLEVKAAHSEGGPTGVLRPGGDAVPGIIVHRKGQTPLLMRLERNRLYLFRRYGPLVVTAVVIFTLLVSGAAFQRHRGRTRLLLALRGSTLDRSSEGLLLIDRRGRVAWLNTTIASWCGRAANGRRGRKPFPITELPPELGAFTRECLACDPPRPLSAASPLHINGGPQFMVRAEPIHAGLRADPHWLIHAQDAAASHAELAAAWAPLARRTAHDLRNPLTSILLTLQRLQMEYRASAPELAPALDTYADRVQQRVDQLRRLASNFLKLVGAEKPQLENHDLNTIVQESVAAIRAGLPPDVRIELRLAEDLPQVAVDPEQMESVLENLAANAINALPGGGTITVSTHLARGLRVSADHPCDLVQLEVLDTGTGIEPAALARLFEPGFSTSDHGSGLGLAIVRKIVEDHGGEVTVESEVGTGTAFTIVLPVAAAAALYAKV